MFSVAGSSLDMLETTSLSSCVATAAQTSLHAWTCVMDVSCGVQLAKSHSNDVIGVITCTCTNVHLNVNVYGSTHCCGCVVNGNVAVVAL